MPNPFEQHNTDPAELEKTAMLEKMTAIFSKTQDLEQQKTIILDKLDKTSVFLEPESTKNLIQAIKNYQGSDLAGFIAQYTSDIWKQEGRYTDPLKYSFSLFKANRERKNYTVLNEYFYYGIDQDRAHIHLHNPHAVIGDESAGTKLMSLRGFLRGLVQFSGIIRERQDIKNISATSALLANSAMAQLMESMGFKNMGEISDDVRQKYFTGDERTINSMIADKDEFCAKVTNFKELQSKLLAALRGQK